MPRCSLCRSSEDAVAFQCVACLKCCKDDSSVPVLCKGCFMSHHRSQHGGGSEARLGSPGSPSALGSRLSGSPSSTSSSSSWSSPGSFAGLVYLQQPQQQGPAKPQAAAVSYGFDASRPQATPPPPPPRAGGWF